MWFDVTLFRLINNLAGLNNALDILGIFAATFLLPILLFLLLPVAFSSKKIIEEKWWEIIVRALCAAGLAYAARTILGWLFFRWRPFAVLPDVHQLISMGPAESSFPSGHASVAFALAFYIFTRDRGWGWSFIILAILVALGRVFVGVHYPLDVFVGFIVGWLAALFVKKFENMEWKKVGRVLRIKR